jgi:signal transduction histidine kinase
VNDKERRIEERYRAGLSRFLARREEAVLLEAYEAGREALASGLGLLAMIGIHHRALGALAAAARLNGVSEEQMAAGEMYLVEALSPFEMVHRGHGEATASLRRINEVLEEEASRIAHTLHAEAGQLLATVYLDLAETEHDLPNSRHHMQRIRSHLDQMREQLRRLSHELRPPMLDDLGLVPALRFLAEGLTRRTGIVVSFEGSLAIRLDRTAELALYRIAQEALNNISRHAQAKQAEICLKREDERICFRIGDDGVGFSMADVKAQTANRGLGLSSIHERLAPLNGTFRIESHPGSGTQLLVTLPLP